MSCCIAAAAKPLHHNMKQNSMRTKKHVPASNCLPFLSHTTKIESRTSEMVPGIPLTKDGNGFSMACCLRHSPSPLASSRKLFQHGLYQASWSGLGLLSDPLDFLVLEWFWAWSTDSATWLSSWSNSGLGRQGWPFFSWWCLNTSSGFEVVVCKKIMSFI